MKKPALYKPIMIIMLGLFTLFFVIHLIYVFLMQEQWDDQESALNTAIKQTDMVNASHAESFSLEQSFMIVYGEDDQERGMIVWIGEDQIHSEFTSDGVTKEQIKSKVLDKDSEIEVLRITPGKYKKDWVWEVFYQKQLQNGKRTYYDYYRFSDGEWLETYTMSLQR